MPLAHATAPAAGGVTQTLRDFGADWLGLAVPLAVLLGIGTLLWRDGRRTGGTGLLGGFARGAVRLTGLPAWSAAGLLVLWAALLVAVLGFFWDVAWHIALGRDEFLLSPPHSALAIGIGLIGVSGILATVLASRSGAAVRWRLGRLHVPAGAAVLLAASGAATVGFWVDELWHWAYGLDVTMWSPPHLTMISAAAFTPMAAWLLMAEARRERDAAGRVDVPRPRPMLWRLLAGMPASATLVGLSAWQLEFDLGVPQWQQVFHPLLVVLAGGLALTAARAALGPGGALRAAAGFVVLRVLLALVTTQVWDLVEPRFAPYVASAIAVELAFALTRGRSPAWRAVAAGLGVATLGLAGEWAVVARWSWIPWTSGLLLRALPLLMVAAVAAALLGVTFGRLIRLRPAGLSATNTALALAVILAALATSLPRRVPDVVADVRTFSAGAGAVRVEVRFEPSDLAERADRLGVLAWQGGGMVWQPLEPSGRAAWATREAVPAGHHDKTMIRLGAGPWLGAVPVVLPADPAIGAAAVGLAARRVVRLAPEQALLLREAHEGPAWPGLVGYGFTAAALATVIGLLIAGTAGLVPHRQGPPPAGVLAVARKGANR